MNTQTNREHLNLQYLEGLLDQADSLVWLLLSMRGDLDDLQSGEGLRLARLSDLASRRAHRRYLACVILSKKLRIAAPNYGFELKGTTPFLFR